MSEGFAQSNQTNLLLRDPYETKGWFLLNQNVCRELGVEQVKVSVKAARTLSNGNRVERVLGTYLTNGKHYVKADLLKEDELQANERLNYSVAGLNADNTVVVEQHGLETDEPAWPELCRETCQGPWWAWALITRSAEGLGSIELNGYAEDGVPAYVYCKTSDWEAFESQFPDPFEYFGIGASVWSEVLMGYGTSSWYQQFGNAFKKVPASLLPAGARNYQGYPIMDLTTEVEVYAIKKGLGPWMTMGSVWTDDIAAQALCLPGGHYSMDLYNSRPEIQQALQWRGYSNLACPAGPGSGGGLNWGVSEDCPDYFLEETSYPTGDNVSTATIIGCAELYGPDGPIMPMGHHLDNVAGVLVNHWSVDGRVVEMVTIPFPGVKDTKLIPVPRTPLEAGLYEFVIVLEDGNIISKFHEFASDVILRADYAAFTNVNIYPVPVTDKAFAIDLDLPLAMNVQVNIVNNMGASYFQKTLNYTIGGLNKEVVQMSPAWPNGLYHATFLYPDGSVDARSFTVNIE